MRACLAAALLALVFAASSSAHAQSANRVWVSGKGTDAPGCGAPTNACRSFQYVHDHIVAAGGEIDVLDGAGYGAVTITKSLGIVAVGAVAAVQQPNEGFSAIIINAGDTDSVHLRGLTLDGLGSAFQGVEFESGASLDIVDCVVRHFLLNGIFIQTSTVGAKVSITGTRSSDNNDVGILIVPTAPTRVAMRRIVVDNNNVGVEVNVGTPDVSVLASVVDSEASGDTTVGFMSGAEASGASTGLSLMHVTASNDGVGVMTAESFSGGSPGLSVGDSLIAGNATGADTATFDGGPIFSFGDNRFNGNGADVNGALTPIAAK